MYFFFFFFNNCDFQPGFRDDYNAITTTFVMTLGEINKEDLFDSEVDLHPHEEVASILFLMFIFLMPMVLINLTVSCKKSVA